MDKEKMFKNKEDLEKVVDDFCKRTKTNREIFEVSSFSNATGGKEKRLYNRTSVINEKCNYVIKYYCVLDLILVWNYKANKNMSYSLTTINEKLAKGIRFCDKGKGVHTKNQALIYFDKSNQLDKLLSLITNQI